MPIVRSNRKLLGGLHRRQEGGRNGIEARRIAAIAKDPADWFAGEVIIEPLDNPPELSRVRVSSVTFQPGARTARYTRSLGEILVVTAGTGWTRCEGGERVGIRAGDVIWCPPDHKHGSLVTWIEQVTDEQYLKGPQHADA